MARFETSVGIDDLVGKFDKHSRITMRRKAWKYPDGFASSATSSVQSSSTKQ